MTSRLVVIARAALAALVGFWLIAPPLMVEAQPAAGSGRIGLLWTASPALVSALREGLLHGLRESGYVAGQNLTVTDRYAEGETERLRDLAAALVQQRVAVIVTQGTPAALAAKAATTTIPIVMTQVGDPVGSGLIKSLAGANGNITGVANLAADISAKRLQLLGELLPKLSRVTAIVDATPAGVRGDPYGRRATEDAGRRLGLSVQMVTVRGPADLASAFDAAEKFRAEALLVLPAPILARHTQSLIDLAAKHRLPAMYPSTEFTDAGGLIAYGPNNVALFSRAGLLVGQILKGAKPTDLPVEQPTKLELGINTRPAKSLGLTIPPSVLLRADKILE